MKRDRSLERGSMFSSPSAFFSAFPTWDNLEERMNQWFGKSTGITVSEDENNIYVEAHLPGLHLDDIDVSLERTTLRVSGEKQEMEENEDKRFHRRAQSTFFYQVDLPAPVEEHTEKAEYQDGVLKIIFKKLQKSHAKKISVQKNGQHQTGSRQTTQQKSGTQRQTSKSRKSNKA